MNSFCLEYPPDLFNDCGTFMFVFQFGGVNKALLHDDFGSFSSIKYTRAIAQIDKQDGNSSLLCSVGHVHVHDLLIKLRSILLVHVHVQCK